MFKRSSPVSLVSDVVDRGQSSLCSKRLHSSCIAYWQSYRNDQTTIDNRKYFSVAFRKYSVQHVETFLSFSLFRFGFRNLNSQRNKEIVFIVSVKLFFFLKLCRLIYSTNIKLYFHKNNHSGSIHERLKHSSVFFFCEFKSTTTLFSNEINAANSRNTRL